MPANMMNALAGGTVNVIGSSSATVIAGPMPGSTPTRVPRVTPMSAYMRLTGVSAAAKPSSSNWSEVTSDHPFQRPAGQRDAEPLDEQQVRRHPHDHRDHGRAGLVLGAQRQRQGEEQQARADDPAEHVQQCREGQEDAADQAD